MKKLVIIGPLPPPFMGPAVATKRFIESEFLKSKLEVIHFDTTDKEGIEEIGLLNFNNIFQGLKHSFLFILCLLKHKPDVVYISIARGFWGFLRDLFFIIPSKIFFVKVIVHLRAGRFDIIHDNGILGKAIAQIGLMFCDKALVLGKTLMGVFGESINSNKVSILCNGMLLEGWDAGKWQDERHNKNTFNIVCISNLYHDKGIHILISSMPEVLIQFPDVVLNIAGDWQGVDYDKMCYKIIEENSLSNCVNILKRVNDEQKKELLRNSDVAVFVPVAPEGLPWVVLEAMSAALPVIGTSQGTMNEVIQNEFTGFIIPTNDVKNLSKIIIELLNDKELRLDMGNNGRKRVEDFYSEKITHNNLVDIVFNVLTKK